MSGHAFPPSVQNQQTYEHPEPPPAVNAVDGLSVGHRATVEGRVRGAEVVRHLDGSVFD